MLQKRTRSSQVNPKAAGKDKAKAPHNAQQNQENSSAFANKKMKRDQPQQNAGFQEGGRGIEKLQKTNPRMASMKSKVMANGVGGQGLGGQNFNLRKEKQMKKMEG